MKQGQIFPSPPHITHLFWDANPEACMSFALMLTKASPVTVYGCPLFDTANTEQAEVQSSHRRPVVHQRETPGSQALSCCSSHPSISLLLPSLPSPPLPAAAWVIGPLASHRHYYRIIMIHSLNGCGQVRILEEGKWQRGKEHWGGLTGGEKVFSGW